VSLVREPDPLWEACLQKVEEMQKQGWRMSSQSPAYHYQNGPRKEPVPRMCVFGAYAPGDSEMAVVHVFHIEARYGHFQEIEVRVDGPFEDSRDRYWLEQRERDSAAGRTWIVTPDYCHYVVNKDVKNGEWAGHAGRLFVFEFIAPGDHVKFHEAGLKVLLAGERDDWAGPQLYHNDGDVPRLYTRNLWHQGYIPPKHRHLWTPNAEMLPGV